jgi:hypothetical protein
MPEVLAHTGIQDVADVASTTRSGLLIRVDGESTTTSVPAMVPTSPGQVETPSPSPPPTPPPLVRCGLFDSTQSILLVGEGDLSFAVSLARKFGDGRRITATTFNSFEFVKKHYANGPANIEELKRLGATVIHDVDATGLHELQKRQRCGRSAVDFASIDAVVFNFPHPGWQDERGAFITYGLAPRYRWLFANHVIQRILNPRFLSLMASYKVGAVYVGPYEQRLVR